MNVLMMYSTHVPTAEHVARIAALGGEVTVATDEAGALDAAPDAEIIFGHRYLRQVLPVTTRLRWVQSTAGGVDRLPLDGLRERGVQLTRMTAAASIIARHAVTLAWALARNIPTLVRQQDARRWQQPSDWLPFPERALVLGTGSIGKAIAKRLRADGIWTAGGRRRDLPDLDFDEVRPAGAWAEALPRTDWLFVAAPAAAGRLVGATEIRALPSHAIVVNVGRGASIDTDALQRALTDGHLGGAALDVFDPTPAGPDDPIWTTPRLTVSPYVAAHHAERHRRTEAMCEAQLARYTQGEPLHDTVDV
ncbi:MAG: NAD(P)-dependent oxidoreductase [Bacteroidota bacterium]